MDTNRIWAEVQDIGGDADAADWRTRLQEASSPRQRIVDKITDTLKRHLPFSGQEGLQELKKIAIRFEEKTFASATSQSDYLRIISLNMLTLETRSQNPTDNSIQFNAAGNTSQNTHDPASLDSSSQTGNANGGDWQEEIFQKIRYMNDMYFPELNDMYQKMAAKLQQHDSLPQQPRNEQLERLKFFKLMLERLIMFLRISKNEVQQSHKEKIVAVEKQIINILSSNRPRKPVSQPHLHTMQQSLQPQSQISQMHLHENQMNSQMYSGNVQGSMTAAQQNNVTNSQNNAAGNTGQNTHDPASLDSSSQTGNANGGDWQEEIFQKIRYMNDMYFPELNDMYQKMAAKLQQPRNEQLERLKFFKLMLERLIMFLRISKNEVQQSHKEKIVAVEKQIINILSSNRPRKPVSQPHLHTMQQSLQPQSQISQMHLHENQMNSQMYSGNVQGSMTAAQQNNVTNSQNNAAGNTGQNTHDPASLDSSSQTGNANGGDWQEEIFQKIRYMNDMYFPELNDMYQKMAAKLQQHDSLPQQPRNEQLERLKFFKLMLERLIMFLRISKNEVQQSHKEKIVAVEKQIINILSSNRPRKPVSQPHLHTMQQSLQPQSQISQMHLHENQMNSQMHSGNVQGSMTAAQQNNVTNSQNNAAGNTGQNTHDPVL